MVSKSKNNTLSIIIVNWNGINFLPACLQSIVENPPNVSFEIIIVDNASSDNSVQWLKSDKCREILGDVDFKLIESTENLGFSRGNNLAIEKTNSPFVFLLNPDTVVKANAVGKLLETLKSDKKIGAVAPKLLNEDGSLQYNVWQFPPNPLTILVEGLKLHYLIPNRLLSNWLYSSHWNYKERKAVPAFSGAAIMAKREMIDRIKAFDEDFHMYGEDAEWCIRMNRNGWKTYFEPEAEIYHLGGLSSIQRWGNVSTRIKEEEGLIYCQKKCISKPLLFCNSITRIFILTLYYIKNLITNKEYKPLAEVIGLYWKAAKSTFS